MPSTLVQVTATGLVVARPPSAVVRTSGTATAGGNNTLTDSGNTFKSNTLAVTGATNATPIEITTAAHGLATGDLVTITGAVGNTAANGTWMITRTAATTFTLNGSVGNGAWTSGGTVVPHQPLRLSGLPLVLTGGTGAPAVRTILSNTATVLTTAGAVWTTNPSTDTTYTIFEAAGPIYLKSVQLQTSAATVGVLAIADALTTGGTALITLAVPAVASSSTTWVSGDRQGVAFYSGIFATITGTVTATFEYDFQ